MTRHPAILAMELAGLARMDPGRVRAAIGFGNRHWLRQLGLLADKPLTTVAETFDVLRTLLDGGTIGASTGAHHFDAVKLRLHEDEEVREAYLRLMATIGPL
jgi:5,10-methylenetetrahydromethanopterin reductase